MNKSIHQFVAICAVATLLTGGMTTAATAADQWTKKDTITVRYGDLNLSHPAGAAELYRRIDRAARKVCGDASMRYALPAVRAVQECERIAVANAVNFVNKAQLTALHNAKGKQGKVG